MSNQTIITLSKGSDAEHQLPISQIIIPDLWRTANEIRDTGKVIDGPGCAEAILECWHIAHDLKNHIVSDMPAEDQASELAEDQADESTGDQSSKSPKDQHPGSGI